MSPSTKLKVIYLVAHLALVPAFLFGDGFDFAISIVIYLVLQTFAVGIGTHRLFAHRSFRTSRAKEVFLTYFSILHALGSPISWATVHLHHHQTADTPEDPHSPHQIPWYHVWLSLYFDRLQTVTLKHARWLMRDPHHVFVHRQYFKLLLAWQLLLLAIGWKVYVFGFCVPVVLVYNITTLGTVVHHLFGYRNYETSCDSRNSWVLSLLTVGDGWHNNHHWRPSHYRQGERWWEFDLQAWLIERFFMEEVRVPSETSARSVGEPLQKQLLNT